MTEELQTAGDLTTACETKFKQAKATINQIRNATPAIVPVNALPPDVLTQIFQLVVNEQPGYFEDQKTLKQFPLVYPETLTHICWRWRQIAMGTCMLWSRIDLVSFQRHPSIKLLARAKVFAARASPSPLNIYLIGRTFGGTRVTDVALNRFFASIGTRIRSINLSSPLFENHQLSALQTCFANCTTGVLEQIDLTVDPDKPSDPWGSNRVSRYPWGSDHDGGDSWGFINDRDSYEPPRPPRFLDISDRCQEDGLLPVRILRLDGMYFHWTSQAYHGLVELSLIRNNSSPSITELEFWEILSRSPRLRVLRFGLSITHLLPDTTSHAAVGLSDLEILDLQALCWDQARRVLRRLSLGSKPLQLSLDFPRGAPPPSFDDEFITSIAGLNVEKLYLGCPAMQYLSLLGLFRLLPTPSLRELSLANFDFPSGSKWASSDQPDHESCSFILSQLNALHLTKCYIDPDELRKVAEVVRIQQLRAVDCRTDPQTGRQLLERDIKGAKFSVVKCIAVPKKVSTAIWIS